MFQGIKLKANPTNAQRLVLSQWMGCARLIWNAKCDENRYYSTYARKYCPIGTYAPIDQKAAQFKSKELTPWLYDCPSQILRNSAVNWYNTYQKFTKRICGKPKIKPKTDKGSIYLTRELFRFETCEDGVTRLFIGSKTNNIGYLSFKTHRGFNEPNSLYIRKECGHYYVSFGFDDGVEDVANDVDNLDYLRGATPEWLEDNVTGVDRGVAISAHTGNAQYDFTANQKRNKEKSEQYIKRLQRRLAKQKKGSNRRRKTRYRISKSHKKISNIRQDFCHKTSRSIVDSDAKVIIFEDLKTSNMTKRPKAKKDNNGKFVSNKAAQKAGLNKAILNVGWHYLEAYTHYKASKAGKAVFKVPAPYTSQECSDCGYTHPSNRKTQDSFVCGDCGYIDNADRNASLVIKKRAIKLILDSGTELAGKGIPLLAKGRGAERKPRGRKRPNAVGNEASKKKRPAVTSVAA
jgi:putative transposase